MVKDFKKFSKERVREYEKSGYRLVGKNKHSALEICRWCKSRLKGKRNCYKSFFGIDSKRCIQFTPTLNFCPFSCLFCWRTFKEDRFKSTQKWDKPKELVDKAILAQREILAGFGGSKNVSEKRFREARQPNHFAISLDGEATAYPHIAELVKEIKRRGFTIFLVSNGAIPGRIKEILERNAIPDNLSISVYATNEEDYKKVTRSFVKKPLERVKKSLELLKKFNEKNCRTNFRLTLVKNLNMKDAKGYSNLIKIASPRFITLKGYSHTGESMDRLKVKDMPSIQELRKFAEEIKFYTNYIDAFEDETSRVIILVRDKEVLNWNTKKIKEQKERYKESLKPRVLRKKTS